jgi:hypothetical protein
MRARRRVLLDSRSAANSGKLTLFKKSLLVIEVNFMDERPQPRRGHSSTRLLVTAAPRAWWAWRTTFALWSAWCAKRSEGEHSHSKKHKHLLHSSTSFLVQLLNTNIAASVLSKFEALSDAMLLKANIAASVLSKFETLSDAISVAAHSLVAPCIREMAQKSFD